jgi:hypothetical protein
MRRNLIFLLFALLFLFPNMALAGGVTEKDFKIQTTQELVNLCTASPDDPLYQQAVNFCYGYLLGAYHYYVAEVSGPKATRTICPPDPPPTRNEAVAMFIEWAKSHPQNMSELPVETEFRFLHEKWPCKR